MRVVIPAEKVKVRTSSAITGRGTYEFVLEDEKGNTVVVSFAKYDNYRDFRENLQKQICR